MNIIFNKILTSYKNKHPFVCFKKPYASNLRAYFEKDSKVRYSETFKEEGFVFAPFDNENPAIIFLNSTSDILEEAYESRAPVFSKNNDENFVSEKENHLELIRLGINAIQQSKFTKVVLSRKEIIQTRGINIIEVFERLLNQSQDAFVYIWFHPKIGLWMGATPEKLVTLKNGEFHTMALASTQAYKNNLNPIWGEKEKKEHQYVLDYIISQIKDQQNGIILKEFTVSDTYTIKAGGLLHLKADIKGVIGDFDLKNLINTLHPTPAVCGLPKESSKSFIKANENYHRSYYTGFLGEINVGLETELFVNLRCVEIDEDSAIIYIGGGITAESNPENEWKETVHKTNTIKSVL